MLKYYPKLMDFFPLSVIDVFLRSAVRVCFFDQYAKGMHAFLN